MVLHLFQHEVNKKANTADEPTEVIAGVPHGDLRLAVRGWRCAVAVKGNPASMPSRSLLHPHLCKVLRKIVGVDPLVRPARPLMDTGCGPLLRHCQPTALEFHVTSRVVERIKALCDEGPKSPAILQCALPVLHDVIFCCLLCVELAHQW